jgi:hypothetical protein
MIMDLEEGIKKHPDNQRKWILLQNNPVINRHYELHIRTREQAPRSSADLERRIAAKICKEYFTDRITLSEISTGSGR